MSQQEYIRAAMQEYAKDITVKQQCELQVVKYKRDVFYDGRWNEFLRAARGLVLDMDYNIVQMPFHKVHNYGVEACAPKFSDDEMVFASRKINGFMAACTWYNGAVLWTTTGSVESPFCQYARDVVASWTDVEQAEFNDIIKEYPETTFLFECVHGEDPHIIDEKIGLHFLGSRVKTLGSQVQLHSTYQEDCFWEGTGVRTIWAQWLLFSDLKMYAAEAQHEGFCFTSEDGERSSKIKSPYYLSKKMLMRTNFTKLTSKHKERLDEEFYPLWAEVHTEGSPFPGLDEQGKRAYIEEYFVNNPPF